MKIKIVFYTIFLCGALPLSCAENSPLSPAFDYDTSLLEVELDEKFLLDFSNSELSFSLSAEEEEFLTSLVIPTQILAPSEPSQQTKPEGFTCPYCDKTFNGKGGSYYRYRHEKKMHREQPCSDRTFSAPFECTLCEKRFSQKANLNVHIKRKHSEVLTQKLCSTESLPKKFICQFCPKSFIKNYYKTRHEEKAHSVLLLNQKLNQIKTIPTK